MSWLGWLFLLAGVYVLVAVARGVVHLFSWLIDEYVVQPRELRRLRERAAAGTRANPGATPPAIGESATAGARERRGRVSASPTFPTDPTPTAKEMKKTSRPTRPPKWLRLLRWSNWLGSLRALSVGKGYDYWVACALAEEDRRLRVRYLSKALQANPAYQPAWGMKGHALFELGQYDEAIACFDRSLALHPSALVWYRRGLCFQQKGDASESLRCFGKALEECGAADRPLMEEIARMKSRVEEQLRCVEAP